MSVANVTIPSWFGRIPRFAVLLLLARGAAFSQPANTQFAEDGVVEFTAAYEAWDHARFESAVELFRRATTNAPSNATNFYWLGTAQFHRMLQLQTSPGSHTNETAAKAALDAAVDALAAAVKLEGRHAESHALLGTLYGMKIDGSIFRALRFGPSVQSHQKQALKFGADNPRVRYLLGMCLFHTADSKGEWKEALETLQSAEKIYEKEAKTVVPPLEPRWGRSSCLTFIGRSLEKLGQRTEAATYFRKALAMHPKDSVAKDGLKRVAQEEWNPHCFRVNEMKSALPMDLLQVAADVRRRKFLERQHLTPPHAGGYEFRVHGEAELFSNWLPPERIQPRTAKNSKMTPA